MCLGLLLCLLNKYLLEMQCLPLVISIEFTFSLISDRQLSDRPTNEDSPKIFDLRDHHSAHPVQPYRLGLAVYLAHTLDFA
ncbi:hypothetical protein BH10CHL1_BH10CHL1_29560 [soil metagenome]